MKQNKEAGGLFPALIKHWRQRRGLSQLDLALEANVSSRHVSFLETGRAQPSREMILRLAQSLSVPLRDQNELLQAAGFGEVYPAPSADEVLRGPVHAALERMLSQQEPYPMVVMDRVYNVLRLNRGATALLPQILADPSVLAEGAPNGYHLLFDPRLARPFVLEWEATAKQLLARLHRESLERAGDRRLQQLLRELLAYPGVPKDWQQPDLSQPSQPLLALRLQTPTFSVGFLTTLTVFSAPQNVTLDEICIESYFPLDEASARVCEKIAGT